MKTNDELQHDVIEEIKSDPRLKSIASEIGVAAKDGVVTLTGEVDTYRKKLAAGRAAQRVRGVKVVAVEIEVDLSGTDHKGDLEIAEAVNQVLKWNDAVDEDEIEIRVDKGWIFLDGVVEWEYQRKMAERAVHDLKGVRGVTNRITLKTKAINPKEVKGKIAAAFHRSATIDASSIQVEMAGSQVKLQGKVRTWAERQEAENAVWSLPGITSVDNKIEVDPTLHLLTAN
jgi:osmotically-inducible protein OsmY